MKGQWITSPNVDVTVIFVHGVLSDGDSCWTNANGCYWPSLLGAESNLGPFGIYVFTYNTGFFSGSYSLSDIVDALKEHMRVDRVSDSRRLIFVCHSMGGIVVRKYIVERAAELIENQKDIGLFLVASPSLGSSYADWLSPLARFLGHSQVDVLRFVRNNIWLSDLDKEFKNLKESGRLRIEGKELVEDSFVALKRFIRRQVVEPFAGAIYFGESFKVAKSDHFSIAKPSDETAIQHRLLCDFIVTSKSSKRQSTVPSQKIPSFVFVFGVPLGDNMSPTWIMMVKHYGPEPAYNCTVEFFDDDRKNLEHRWLVENPNSPFPPPGLFGESQKRLHIAEFGPEGSIGSFEWRPLDPDRQHYTVSINCRDGVFVERWEVTRVEGILRAKITIEHGPRWVEKNPTLERVVFKCEDPEFVSTPLATQIPNRKLPEVHPGWKPNHRFEVPVAIIDPNGHIQIVSAVKLPDGSTASDFGCWNILQK